MSPPSERDFERTNLLLAFTAGAGAMALALMFVLTFSGGLLCK